MNALLVATCETFQKRASLDAANALAAETAARLKPLVARAGAVINGYDLEHSEDMTTGEQQATVDALFETLSADPSSWRSEIFGQSRSMQVP